jgi:hypothetical protein
MDGGGDKIFQALAQKVMADVEIRDPKFLFVLKLSGLMQGDTINELTSALIKSSQVNSYPFKYPRGPDGTIPSRQLSEVDANKLDQIKRIIRKDLKTLRPHADRKPYLDMLYIINAIKFYKRIIEDQEIALLEFEKRLK